MDALIARFPRLAQSLPRAALGVCDTPVESWRVDGTAILIKRDDCSAPRLGGNKVRALEFLLAGVGRGDTVLTVGATGSTHALAVAEHAATCGARCEVITWPQESHDTARATAARMARVARVAHSRSVAGAFLRAASRRLLHRRRWIPAGGSIPLGALGHVSAALELVSQLERDGRALPTIVVAPLGSGGTVAGLLAGFAIAGVPVQVLGVRVVPAIVANRWHVLRLARATRALVASVAGERVPGIDASRLVIHHGAFGGAYGRETPEATAAARLLRDAGGPSLDPTYSAKAFAVALARAHPLPDNQVLFWLTFDARWLADDASPAETATANPRRAE